MARRSSPKIDEVDKKILRFMLHNGKLNLKDIADNVGVSKSTVHNRLKRLEKMGIIKGIIPWLDHDKLGNEFTAISLIRAKYGPNYAEEVGKKLASIEGVWGVYFVLGENDFIVLSRAKNRAQLEHVIESFTKIEGVERSSTAVALKVIKEDPRDAFRID